MKVRKAIIPAAGLGTCFLPSKKAQPKEMLIEEIEEENQGYRGILTDDFRKL